MAAADRFTVQGLAIVAALLAISAGLWLLGHRLWETSHA